MVIGFIQSIGDSWRLQRHTLGLSVFLSPSQPGFELSIGNYTLAMPYHCTINLVSVPDPAAQVRGLWQAGAGHPAADHRTDGSLPLCHVQHHRNFLHDWGLNCSAAVFEEPITNWHFYYFRFIWSKMSPKRDQYSEPLSIFRAEKLEGGLRDEGRNHSEIRNVEKVLLVLKMCTFQNYSCKLWAFQL